MLHINSILFLIFIPLAFISNFTFEVTFALVVLILILRKFQISNIPYSIQYYFLFFFIQITTIIPFIEFGEETDILNDQLTKDLVVITLIQLMVIVSIFCVFFGNNFKIQKEQLIENISKIKFNNLLMFYFFMSLLFPLISSLSSNNSSLQQFFMAIAVLKDFALILFAFHFTFFKEKRTLILFIFLVEFLLGFISYFSSFKDIIIYIIIVALTVSNRITFKGVLKLLPFFIFVVVLMSFWSSVKGDYREYLRDGGVSQNVNRENSLAANFLIKKIKNFNLDELEKGFVIFLGRAQYLAEYQTVRQKVPAIMPHENGKIILDAFEFILVPRFLKPDKKVLDPSTKTAKYTQRNVANVEMGTSISLGFFADLYIDFGFFGMTLALVILFAFLGIFLKRIAQNNKYSLIFNISILAAVVTHIGTFESDLTFYIGIIRNYVVVYIFCDIFVFKSLNRFLTGEKEKISKKEKSKMVHLSFKN